MGQRDRDGWLEAESELRIDAMIPSDFPEVLAIEEDSFDEPWPERVFRGELRHSWSHAWVLRRDIGGPVLGYTVFWRVSDELRILNIAIDPKQRTCRNGRALIDKIRAFAISETCRFITIEVSRSNGAAIAMSESCGFKKVGVRPARGLVGPVDDTLVLLCDLGSVSQVGPLPRA